MDKQSAEQKLAQLAQEALDVQNASNLCGIAQSFARAMVELNTISGGYGGTDWVNQHPITRLWISKFMSLAGYNNSQDEYHAACVTCEELTKAY